MNYLGLDIGGANLKASNGHDWTAEVSFPLWKTPELLTQALRDLTKGHATGDTVLAVTMTGELVDCFRTKSEGVHWILHAVDQAFPQVPDLRIWQTGGEFFSLEEAQEFPVLVAAANWHALASWAGRACLQGTAILMDIGSTTTDIIPIQNGIPVSEGGTDPHRLASGELVYTGVRRTPLMSLGTHLAVGDQSYGVAAELFATTRDLYLWTGDLPEVPEDCETANGKPATRECAYDRLARMFCGDREEFDPDQIQEAVANWKQRQVALIRSSLQRVMDRQQGPIDQLIFSGEGEFLARAVIAEIPHLVNVSSLSLAGLLGPAHSIGACAFAVARLAIERP